MKKTKKLIFIHKTVEDCFKIRYNNMELLYQWRDKW